jgi:proline dehydrogenase
MRHGFARRFVAGETLDQAMAASAELHRAGRRVILNLLGENVATAEESRHSRDSYLAALTALGTLDGAGGASDAGESRMARANISIKLTQLGLDFDRDACLTLTSEIAAAAANLGRSIEIDMEGTPYTGRTLNIYETVQREHGNVGLALQAYLRRSAADLERLSALNDGTRRVKIRLVKGAYHEPAAAAFQKKSDVDANYRRLLDRLLQPGAAQFFTAIATHDPTLVAHAEERIKQHALTADDYEFQMIYGIRRDLQEQVRAQGHPLRVYVPFGTAWCPYFMRRLSERPANLWFVLRSLLAERNAGR